MDDSVIDFGEHFFVGIEEDEQFMHLYEIERSSDDLYLNVIGVNNLLLH